MHICDLNSFLELNKASIDSWFTQFNSPYLPLYCSMDVRVNTYKSSVIDTNLFPGGFNNLTDLQKAAASTLLCKEIEKSTSGKRVLLIVEEHTRNVGYIANILSLKYIFKQAGFDLCIASFFDDNPFFVRIKAI